MNVSDLMTTTVKSCGTHDNLQRAAQIMWENDCGIVPVVDGDRRVVGMISDRDVCMAAYTQGRPLYQIPVSKVMAKQVFGVHENDPIEAAEDIMQRAHVRRVPVFDGDGRIKGLVSMNDLARNARGAMGSAHKANGLSGDNIMQTLAAIGEPTAAAATKKPAANSAQRFA